jgi:hypothetical protein
VKRDALRRFLRQLVVASLPLAPLACNREPLMGDGGGAVDSASAGDQAAGPHDMAGDQGVPADDMAVPVFDLAGDMVDMCLAMPPATKQLPRDPDAGAPVCIVDCEPARPQGYLGIPTCQEVATDGGKALECTFYACGLGRRPAGFAEGEPMATDEIGAFWARAAALEAASVHAFERLAGELEEHGAPRRWSMAARRAARDEVRHARATARLARRCGAEPAVVRVPQIGRRSLEAIAVENAVEGCVGETWGAAVALFQAEAAADPAVRRAKRPIAEDEAGHAELAQAIDRWAQTRLDADARARVAEARARAAREIADAALAPRPALAGLGLPPAAAARRMLDGLRRYWG